MTNEIRIKELDLEQIQPTTQNFMNPEADGSKIAIISKPGNGKTTLIKSILFNKKHIFPAASVVSGSEENDPEYKDIFPSTFIHTSYSEQIIVDFIQRQKYARKYLENPWAICLLDDCTDDIKIFNSPHQHTMFKRGRHMKSLYIVSLQYALDLKPGLRTCIDWVFILREPNIKMRKIIWENYASIIPDFTIFCSIMDQLTNDFTALVIKNRVQSNNMEDCIFYYKAEKPPTNFRFGCKDYWKFHEDRFDPNYTKT